MTGLFYNGMAPAIAYKFPNSKFLNFCVNLGRILTLHPPLKRGQFHTLATMKQLAFSTKKIVKAPGYRNELVENVTKAVQKVPTLLTPLKNSVRKYSWTGNIPAFVQIDFDAISGGKYEWTNIKELIIRECGWVAPDDAGKGLHTSCKIEKMQRIFVIFNILQYEKHYDTVQCNRNLACKPQQKHYARASGLRA